MTPGIERKRRSQKNCKRDKAAQVVHGADSLTSTRLLLFFFVFFLQDGRGRDRVIAVEFEQSHALG